MRNNFIADRPGNRQAVIVAAFALSAVLLGALVLFFAGSGEALMAFASGETIFLGAEPDMEEVWRPESGSYNEFVMLVQQANGTFDPHAAPGIPPEPTYVVLEEELWVEPPGFVYLSAVPLSEDLQRFTYERCQELDLEYELVLALMWRESRFQVNAVGYNTNGTKDNGIMQINDINRTWLRNDYGITDLMDPYQNIIAGTAILAEFMHTYDDENIALMAYNFGEAGMRRQVANGVTTTRTVQQAQEKRDSFRELMQSA